ncbi:DUF4037 domain-containing protein [Demequina mangrovi]|uniref:Tetratricopeptide repeat-containing protein n=1 Tax=Demequina mangrovi TaxID=1043493 RepID=A0A1H6WBE7_9MICO|nr:DUF4037 domain-containing protein [Demequina mangrovi]SEJ14359.1 Tetratricopeptide repeat-containing protein [Demequina mangrovi]
MTTDSAPGYDVEGFLRALDRAFAEHRGATDAEPLIREALSAAREAGDRGAELTVLNEAMGFHRSVSRHEDALAAAREAEALLEALRLAGSEASATTWINIATARRAAGRLDDAEAAYGRALAEAEATMGPRDRRLAALRNNLALLRSDRGDHAGARRELEAALAILEAATVDPGADLDIAGTRTNLALECFRLELPDEAAAHAGAAMAILRRGGHEGDPHAAATLAGHAEACFRMGRLAEAVDAYERALAIVAECYGTGSDAHAVTAANLAEARAALAASSPTGSAPEAPDASSLAAPERPAPEPLTGLELARSYWEQVGLPMMQERHPALLARAAVGLVGHGSDRYGFDDALSRDHDSGPGFCVWLTAEDHAAHGAALQADYDALPREHRGHEASPATARATGGGRRVGVFEIGEFFEGLTGHREAPATPHAWLLLDEATLAAATNGAVFRDPLGAFSRVRDGFRRMPDDVRLALVSRRIGMMAQAGQYNVPRMLARGDGEAAWLAVAEFVDAASSAVFLLNRPSAVGYLPYYKWRFAALRALAARPATRLPGVHARLSDAVRLASAACLGGAGFGEGGAGAGPAREGLEAAIADVCAQVVRELRDQGLSRETGDFLEAHRAQLGARISDPWLRAL